MRPDLQRSLLKNKPDISCEVEFALSDLTYRVTALRARFAIPVLFREVEIGQQLVQLEKPSDWIKKRNRWNLERERSDRKILISIEQTTALNRAAA
jgi:hypothetical protein